MGQRQRKTDQHIRQQQTFAVFSQRFLGRSGKTVHSSPSHFEQQKNTKSYVAVAKPIHTSFHRHLSHDRAKGASHESDTEELSFSHRQLQMRVTKYNEFNRRNFQEGLNQRKNLYLKNIRKCRSNLMKIEFQSAMQSMIIKKQVSSKMPSERRSPDLLDAIKQKIEESSRINNSQIKTIINNFNRTSQVVVKLHPHSRLQSPSLPLKGVHFKTKATVKPIKRHRGGLQSSFEVRPWEQSQKVATQPPERGGRDSCY